MIQTLISRYKTFKKTALLNQLTSSNKKYAFVGVGNHSISNLYPVIDYLGVSLKYICTKTQASSSLIANRYHARATVDINDILNDKEVEGVFVCTSPSAHFGIVKQLLNSGKQVFVEKPPCLSSSELEELITIQGDNEVVVGVQKRYGEVMQTLKKRAKNITSYNYRYLTGAYPEGDPFWDLFIHPLDVVSFLFGDYEEVKVLAGASSFVQIKHTSGVIGSLELSTDYTWDTAQENLVVNTEKGVFESTDCYHLMHTSKSATMMGVPLEKVFKKSQKQELLVHVNGFVPLNDYNSLALQGYFQEVEMFVKGVETGRFNNESSLSSLKGTYRLIEEIKNAL